jgi:hypothetical protein
MDTYLEESFSTKVAGAFDVIVCGGGVAGLAAAVSAARLGSSVLLLEKSVNLGGLATNGLISYYEPICNGLGDKLMYGMASELFQLAIAHGPDTLDDAWRSDPDHAETTKRYEAFYSPTIFTLALDRWLLSSGVKLLLDTLVVRPVMEKTHCQGLVVEHKGGREYYQAKVVVDATGDADILYRAGVPCVAGSNFLTYIAYMVDEKTIARAGDTGNLLDSRHWHTSGSDLWGKGHPADAPRLSGLTAEEVTEFVLSGRKLLTAECFACGKGTFDLSCLPSMAQLRTTRRLEGAYTLQETDQGRTFADSMGVAVDFSKRGHVYELPYRILYHQGFDNLFTAGRSVSSSGWAWEVTRVIPVAIATGQAAGVAAALCCQSETSAPALEIKLVQDELVRSGVRLHNQN